MNLTDENLPEPKIAPVNYSIFGVPGALLSYLVPGLGQIFQGRMAKACFSFSASMAYFTTA